MEIFIGNLPYEISEQDITDAFGAHGAVARVKMLTDKFSGRFRGMAFVTMENDTEGQAAIDALTGTQMGGRDVKIEQARPREDRPQGGFGGGPRGGGGGFRPRSGGFGGGPRGEGRGGFGGGRPSGGGGFKKEGFRKGGFKPRDGGFRRDEGGEF